MFAPLAGVCSAAGLAGIYPAIKSANAVIAPALREE